MPNNVVVDDTDSSINYSGSWQEETGSTRQWEGTVHESSHNGDSFKFTFAGTSISVIGTISAGTDISSGSYSIDGSSPVTTSQQSNSAAQYDVTFWTSPLLQDGQHTLTVTNAGASSAGYFFDRITYIPSDNVVVSGGGTGGSAGGSSGSSSSSSSSSISTSGSGSGSNSGQNSGQGTTVTVTTHPSTTLNIVAGQTFAASLPSSGTGTALLAASTTAAQNPNSTGQTNSSGGNASYSTGTGTISNSNPGSISGSSISGHGLPLKSGSGGIAASTISGTSETKTVNGVVVTVTAGSSSSSGASRSNINVGALAGGVVAGVLVLLVLAAILIFCRKRNKRHFNADEMISAPAPAGGRRYPWMSKAKTNLTPFQLSNEGAYSQVASASNPHVNANAVTYPAEKRGLPYVDSSPIPNGGYGSTASNYSGTVGGGASEDPVSPISKYTSMSQSPTATHSLSIPHFTAFAASVYSEDSDGSTAQNGIPPSAYGSVSLADPHDVPPSYQSARVRASASSTFYLDASSSPPAAGSSNTARPLPLMPHAL